MKVAIVTVQIPFITGGAEVLASSLREQLRVRGHEAEIIALPFKWYPPGRILDCMLGARLVDLTEVNGTRIDRLIALKFPAYYVEHPQKSLWLLHQHRQAYDFYGTSNSDLSPTPEGREVAAEIKRWDDEFLATYKNRCTIAKTVSRRLQRFNDLDSIPLYPPLNSPEHFTRESFDDFIFYPSRFDTTKRQHLLLDALERTPSKLKAVLTGQTDSAYGRSLLARVEGSPVLRDRVKILGLVPEKTKLELYARCAAVYNGVYDEDYGYVTIEAFFASKPVITHTDSGGPTEFVEHGKTGWVVAPQAPALADCLNTIAGGRAPLRELGDAARRYIESIDLSWDRVVSTLLA
jgi:glycosyltransferase involved in cell wall biosynthesis